MSILKIMEASYYNKQTAQWESYAPKTVAEAVETKDGSNVQTKLDAIPGQISTAVNEIKGGVADGGNTLAKLHTAITSIQTLLQSDDTTLDTLQEVVDYIKANSTNLALLGTNKVNIADIVNNLTTVGTVEGKVLDARQGKVIKDAIDAIASDLASLQTVSEDFATKTEVSIAVSSAMPVVSETAPNNPADRQIWLRPVGSVEM